MTSERQGVANLFFKVVSTSINFSRLDVLEPANGRQTRRRTLLYDYRPTYRRRS